VKVRKNERVIIRLQEQVEELRPLSAPASLKKESAKEAGRKEKGRGRARREERKTRGAERYMNIQ
jgi:hypothetical protein